MHIMQLKVHSTYLMLYLLKTQNESFLKITIFVKKIYN